MRSTSPCVIALMSMFCPSSDSTEALMVVYAALAVLMPRSVSYPFTFLADTSSHVSFAGLIILFSSILSNFQ